MARTAIAIKARQDVKAAQIQASLDKLFDEPLANQLETMRHKARSKRRIVYDCHQARVVEDDEDGLRVSCPHYVLNTRRNTCWLDGSITLKAVLRGSSLNVCQSCPKYDDEDEPVAETPKARDKDGYVKIAPSRTYSGIQTKIHIRDATRMRAHGGCTLCGVYCGSWTEIDSDEPVSCSNCLRHWQERR